MPTLDVFKPKEPSREELAITELIGQVKEARREAEEGLVKLATLSDSLRSMSRKSSNEMTDSVVAFATGHSRFASTAAQGMKRTARLDRLMDSAKREQEANAKWEEEQLSRARERRAKKAAQAKAQILISPVDEEAVDDLYGAPSE